MRKAGKFVYHLACFTCDICLRQLNTGEQFTVDIQEKELVRLLCQLHFAVNQYQQQSEDGRPPSFSQHLSQSAGDKRTSAAINESGFVSRSTTSSPNRLSLNQVLRFEPPPLAGNFCEREQHQLSSKGFQQASFNRDQYLHLLATTNCQTNDVSNSVDCPKQTHNSELEFNSSGDLVGNRQPTNSSNVNCQLQLNNELSMASQHQILTRRPGPISSSSSSSNGSSSTGRLIGVGGGVGGGHPSKSKRVRTTFTEEQLATLQNYFQVDSNPDGQDLERIATITRLSKRVTQVWFQNSRARQKKYMIKRKPASGSLSAVVSAHVLTAGGSASNQHQTNPIFMQSSNRILAEQPLAGIATNKENYQTGGVSSKTIREKSWPANMSDRSELSLDEQAAIDDLDDDDGDSSVGSIDQRDDGESENDIIDQLEDE